MRRLRILRSRFEAIAVGAALDMLLWFGNHFAWSLSSMGEVLAYMKDDDTTIQCMHYNRFSARKIP